MPDMQYARGTEKKVHIYGQESKTKNSRERVACRLWDFVNAMNIYGSHKSKALIFHLFRHCNSVYNFR